MKTVSLLLSFVCILVINFGVSGCSTYLPITCPEGAKVNISENKIYAECVKGALLDGKEVWWWDKLGSTKKKKEIDHVLGKKHGKETFWYFSGQIKSDSIYDQGLKSGLHNEWYEDGKKKIESNYENDKLTGLYQEWYPNGKKKIESKYEEDKLNGSYQKWSLDGSLNEEANYLDGKLDGVSKKWSKQGVILEESVFKNGKLNGKRMLYKNGKKEAEEIYVDGKPTGTWEFYYSNGDIKKRIQYDDQKQWGGKYTTWFTDGIKESEGKIENNEEIATYLVVRNVDGKKVIALSANRIEKLKPLSGFLARYNLASCNGLPNIAKAKIWRDSPYRPGDIFIFQSPAPMGNMNRSEDGIVSVDIWDQCESLEYLDPKGFLKTMQKYREKYHDMTGSYGQNNPYGYVLSGVLYLKLVSFSEKYHNIRLEIIHAENLKGPDGQAY